MTTVMSTNPQCCRRHRAVIFLLLIHSLPVGGGHAAYSLNNGVIRDRRGLLIKDPGLILERNLLATVLQYEIFNALRGQIVPFILFCLLIVKILPPTLTQCQMQKYYIYKQNIIKFTSRIAVVSANTYASFPRIKIIFFQF